MINYDLDTSQGVMAFNTEVATAISDNEPFIRVWVEITGISDLAEAALDYYVALSEVEPEDCLSLDEAGKAQFLHIARDIFTNGYSAYTGRFVNVI